MKKTEMKTEMKPEQFEPHDLDDVVVEVLWAVGVTENGRTYAKGERFVYNRGQLTAQNRPGRQVYRVLMTVQYHNDRTPEARWEKQPDTEPIDLTPAAGTTSKT